MNTHLLTRGSCGNAGSIGGQADLVAADLGTVHNIRRNRAIMTWNSTSFRYVEHFPSLKTNIP